jgi:predicted ATPase
MRECQCKETHPSRRIVLTGGPGAGKTAVLELVRLSFCKHVDVLPESASILFGGGFRRGVTPAGKAASQRAIFQVQRELEAVAEVEANAALTLCDRGTVDGAAYWPGAGDFFAAFGTTREAELKRYEAVIHLRTPHSHEGYNQRNPVRIESVRIESAAEAATIDAALAKVWDGHPRVFLVENQPNFLQKAHQVIEILRAAVPACCRQAALPPASV